MPSKKGSKYLNAKTYSVLSKYTPEDIQKLLNSGQFKSDTENNINQKRKRMESLQRWIQSMKKKL